VAEGVVVLEGAEGLAVFLMKLGPFQPGRLMGGGGTAREAPLLKGVCLRWDFSLRSYWLMIDFPEFSCPEFAFRVVQS